MFSALELSIVLLVSIFGSIYSLLARDFVKEKLNYIRSYQRFYTIIALSTLVFLILIELAFASHGTRIDVIINNPLLGILFVFVGGFFLFGGMLQLHLSRDSKTIQLNGFFAFARHPTYLGGIIMLTSLTLFFLENSVHFMFLLSLALYLFVGSLIEDHYLLRNNPDYIEYRNNCGKYFPWQKKHFNYFYQHIKPKKSK